MENGDIIMKLVLFQSYFFQNSEIVLSFQWLQFYDISLNKLNSEHFKTFSNSHKKPLQNIDTFFPNLDKKIP